MTENVNAADLAADLAEADVALAGVRRRIHALELARETQAAATLAGARQSILAGNEIHPREPWPELADAPQDAEETALRASIRELEGRRASAIAALATGAGAVRTLLAELSAVEAEITDAGSAADAAEANAAAAEVAATAAAIGDGADAADVEATRTATAARQARRRLAGLATRRDALRAELSTVAPAVRSALDGAADELIAACERRYRRAIAQAVAARDEALGVACMVDHPTAVAIRNKAIPTGLLVNDLAPRPGMSDAPLPLPKGSDDFTALVALVRVLDRAAPARPLL